MLPIWINVNSTLKRKIVNCLFSLLSCFVNQNLHCRHRLPTNLHDATAPLSVILLATLWPLRVSMKQKWQMSNCQSVIVSGKRKPPCHVVMAIKHNPFKLTEISWPLKTPRKVQKLRKKKTGFCLPQNHQESREATKCCCHPFYNNPRLEFYCLPFYCIAQQTSVYISLGPRQTCPLLGLIHPDCNIFGIWADMCCFVASN